MEEDSIGIKIFMAFAGSWPSGFVAVAAGQMAWRYLLAEQLELRPAERQIESGLTELSSPELQLRRGRRPLGQLPPLAWQVRPRPRMARRLEQLAWPG